MCKSNGSVAKWSLSSQYRTNAQSGFTLLEVIVALICAALILGTVLRIFSLGLRTADSAEKRALAAMLAQSVMTEITVSEPLSPREGFGALRNGFRFSYRIASYEDTDMLQRSEDHPQEFQLFKVDVAVNWGAEGSSQGTVTLTTLRLGNEEYDLSATDQSAR